MLQFICTKWNQILRIATLPLMISLAFTLGTERAEALTFNLLLDSSIAGNMPAIEAFQRAADTWSSVIQDDMTVSIRMFDTPQAGNILANASPVFTGGNYDIIRQRMIDDAANEQDDWIVNHLPTSSQISWDLPEGFTTANTLISHSVALQRAWGFQANETLFNDGNIRFNSAQPFDYDNRDGITGGHYDFESVALHEIGHILGFESEVNLIDGRIGSGSSNTFTTGKILDLFRFADEPGKNPETVSDFTNFSRSLVPGQAAVTDFILPFGADLVEVPMSTGRVLGDGFAPDHYKDNGFTGVRYGIFDPAFAPGEIVGLSTYDLRIMDLMGYDIDFAIPEPTSISFFLLAMAGASRLIRPQYK